MENVYELRPSELTTAVKNAQAIVSNYLHRSGVGITAEARTDFGIEAFYSWKHDSIEIRPVNTFKSLDHYYSTVFHELAHSTGHSDRLHRFSGAEINGPQYLREEMVAELASAFLDEEVGTKLTSVDHEVYLRGVIGANSAGPRTIAWAAQEALKAADLILGRESVAAREALGLRGLAA